MTGKRQPDPRNPVPKKPPSGHAKMKASGRRAIMLAVSPEQHDLLTRAAAREMRPVSQFVTFHAVQAATAILVDT